MALDTTVGGASANSYASLAEFNSYWTGRMIPTGQAAPSTFSDADKESQLKQATIELDLLRYRGRQKTETQALKWPRTELYTDEGWVVDSDTIPQKIKDAQCELAYALLLEPALTDGDGLDRFSGVSFGGGQVSLTPRPGAESHMPRRVLKLLRDFLATTQAKVLRA